MNLIENILNPFINIINRQINIKTPALELSNELEGKIICMKIKDTNHNLNLIMSNNNLQLHAESTEYDLQITGSLLTFVGLIKNDPENAVRDGQLNFQGDIATGQKFQKLMQYAKPDVEEELSNIVGDVTARGLGKTSEKFSTWLTNSQEIIEQNISEYMQEERKILPSQYEFIKFQKEIDKLRDDVDRIEIKLNRLLNPDN
tara:strand:+ start:912 stop:1517 length:606 start_codon:yes stop_codon:yes gene_type:complete